MSWLLLYILAGHLVTVPDLPSEAACMAAAAEVTDARAHSFACVAAGVAV
jgi:hypothetical protein